MHVAITMYESISNFDVNSISNTLIDDKKGSIVNLKLISNEKL